MNEDNTETKPNTEPTSGRVRRLVSQIVMNQKIKKEAEKLGLKITEYHGFVRGRVWDGEMNHCGAWEFETIPANNNTDEESMNVFAYNITDALRQMEENAAYFYG